MPIVQKYRDCKCIEECYDMFQQSVHYDYYLLSPGQVGVMGPNDDTLVIMTEELFWKNFTDPLREHRRKKV